MSAANDISYCWGMTPGLSANPSTSQEIAFLRAHYP